MISADKIIKLVFPEKENPSTGFSFLVKELYVMLSNMQYDLDKVIPILRFIQPLILSAVNKQPAFLQILNNRHIVTNMSHTEGFDIERLETTQDLPSKVIISVAINLNAILENLI